MDANQLNEAIGTGLVGAVRAKTKKAVSLAEAWAQVIAVQAQIALEVEGGSKATSAARFIAQLAGLEDLEKGDGPDELALTVEEARALKAWLENAGTPPAGDDGEDG